MMSNVEKFYPANSAKKADNVLEQAIGCYDDVLVIGYDDEGYLVARASASLSDGDVLLLLERFKAKILAGDYAGDA